MSEWQPIETAPKDGTRILAWWPLTWLPGGDYALLVFGTEDEPWCGATHWMPLPEPPLVGKSAEIVGKSD